MRLPIKWGNWDHPTEPIQWLIEGIIPEGAVVMLSAEPGSYKSFLIIEMALAVAEGRPVGQRFKTRAGRSLYVDFDAGYEITRRRVGILSPGRSVPDFGYLSGSEIGNVFDDLLWNSLRDDAPDLLIVDTLAAGSPGIDENDKRFGDVLIKARLLSQSRGTASVFIHHLNNGGGVRGSSALRGNPDVDYRAERTDSGTIRVVCKKMKHAVSPPPFSVDVSGLAVGRGMRVLGQ